MCEKIFTVQIEIMDPQHLLSFRHCHQYSVYYELTIMCINLHIKKKEILNENLSLGKLEKDLEILDSRVVDIRYSAYTPERNNELLEIMRQVRIFIIIFY